MTFYAYSIHILITLQLSKTFKLWILILYNIDNRFRIIWNFQFNTTFRIVYRFSRGFSNRRKRTTIRLFNNCNWDITDSAKSATIVEMLILQTNEIPQETTKGKKNTQNVRIIEIYCNDNLPYCFQYIRYRRHDPLTDHICFVQYKYISPQIA